MDREKIQKQARQILDNFAEALASVEKEKIKEEGYAEREDFEREEGKGEKDVECRDFKEKLLKNAPQHDEDFVIAERGEWK